jgi:hypothetical protein
VSASARAAWLVLALCGCERKQPAQDKPVTPPAPVVVPVDAVTTDGGVAPPSRVDLRRAVPMVVRVSSQVRNRKILPKHIVDGDLATAWNSATGHLVGSWIEVELERAAVIEEVRMTVGFTGRGPKGEDYFTMNPRIAKVAVRADRGAAVTVALDVESRDLQAVPVRATRNVRIDIRALVPGSKKDWREVSVSELEVWGTPPAGWVPPPKPLVPLVVVAPAVADVPCADIEQRQAEFVEPVVDPSCTQGCDDHAYPPECEEIALPNETLPAPWRGGFGECDIADRIYGPKTCTVRFKRGAEHAHVSIEADGASTEVGVTELVQQDVIAGAPAELLVRIAAGDRKYIAVCRSEPLACTDAIEVGGDGWTADARFVDGELVLAAASGTPPAGVVGRRPLVFE